MEAQITKERSESYVEVIEILKHMDERYFSRIPQKVQEFFLKNSSKDYKFNVDLSKPLEEQNLKKNTLAILAMLDINYWCEDEEEKQRILKRYYENETIYRQKMSESNNI